VLNLGRDVHKLDFGVVWTIISCLSQKKPWVVVQYIGSGYGEGSVWFV